jgi:DNA gyrase/topoisomerase IV subunit B
MKKKITSYSDFEGPSSPDNFALRGIQVLSFPQAVRKRPGMYFARVEDGKYITDLDNPKRLTKFILEAICLSRANAIEGNVSQLKIAIKNGNEVMISDNSHGFCTEQTQIVFGNGAIRNTGKTFLESLLTDLYACKIVKHENVKDICDMGVVMTNIVSKTFTAINKYKNIIQTINYSKGELVKSVVQEENTDGATGLMFSFVFDEELFGALKIDKDDLLAEIEKIRSITSAEIIVEFN